MTRTHGALGAALAFALTGCGPEAGPDTESGGTTGASDGTTPTVGGTQTSTTTTAGPTSTVTDPSTTTTATSSTTTDPTDATDSGGSDCVPPGVVDVRADFLLDPWIPALSATCTVNAVDHSEGEDHVQLQCDGQLRVLTVRTEPYTQLYVGEGEEVTLDYIEDPIFWTNRWFALRRVAGRGALIAGGVSGSALDPPDMTVGELFGGMPTLDTKGLLCEQTRGDCNPVERMAIDATALEYTWRVFDGNHGSADFLAFGFRVLVQEATIHHEPHGCTDTPSRWHQLVVGSFPSE